MIDEKKIQVLIKLRVYAKDGKLNRCLICDLGYRIAYVSFDMMLICELMNKTPNEIYSLSIGDYVIGEIK